MTGDFSSLARTAALVMAAGRGERLGPLTSHTPKCLIEVGGIPVLDRWWRKLAEAGVRNVFINTHHLPEPVRERVALYNEQAQSTWHLIHEHVLLGTAGTVFAFLRDHKDFDRLLIIYADNVSDVDLSDLLQAHMGTKAHLPFTVSMFHAEDPASCGIAEIDANNIIVDFVEKPDEPASDLANAGIIVAETEALRQNIAEHDEDLSRDVLPRLCGKMLGFTLPCYHKDYGTPERLKRVSSDLEEGKFERGAPASELP